MTDPAYEILVALGQLTPLQRERWIDTRIVGMTLEAVAQRDNVSRAAIWIGVSRADKRIRRHVLGHSRVERQAA